MNRSFRPARWFALLALASTLGLAACSAGSDASTNDGAGEEVKARAARFETFEGMDGKQYFHVLAGNGEMILRSQAYSSQQAADKGIASVLQNAVDRARFDMKQAKDGQWYFNVKAGNNETIASSEMYVSRSNADRAADAVVRLVKKAVRASTNANPGARFQTFAGLDGLSYFHLRAANGEIVLRSQGYADTTGAKNGVESLRLNGREADKFEVLGAADGQFYFSVKAGNGEIIATSETYVSQANADRALKTAQELLKPEVPIARAE